MDKVIKRIDIDLYSPTNYEIINAQQGDNYSRIIEFVLYDQGKPYNLSSNGISVRIEGHRGDQSSFIKSNICSITDNIITVILDSDILYACGTVEARIVLSNGDMTLSTIPFRLRVTKNPCDKNVIERDKRSLIDDMMSMIENLKISLNNTSNVVISKDQPTNQKEGDYWLKITD